MVVLMEYKSGFLRQDARYSNDVTKFMNDMNTKIGVGCKQLARDISSLFPDVGKAKKRLDGVPIPSNAEWAMPVMVVQDLMLDIFRKLLFESALSIRQKTVHVQQSSWSITTNCHSDNQS